MKKDILTLWKKNKKDGSPFYSGYFVWNGVEKEVNIWIDNEAMAGLNNRPAIRMVEREPRAPGESRQPKESEIYGNQTNLNDEIPF